MIDNVVDSLFPLFLATTCVVSGLELRQAGVGETEAASARQSRSRDWGPGSLNHMCDHTSREVE